MTAAHTIYCQLEMEEFLSSAVTDNELLEIYAAEKFLSENRFNSPWLRELEVRLRSNDQEIGLEDYRLRFGLINPFEIRANSNYRKELVKTVALRKSAQLNDVLRMRYSLIIENYYLNQRIEINSEYLKFLERLANIELQNGTESYKDILESNKTILELQLKLIDLRRKLDVNELLIGERAGQVGSIVVEEEALVGVDQIWRSLFDSANSLNVNEQLDLQEQKLDESLYDIEKAQSRRNIGFVQAEYDVQRGNEFNEHIGYQVGVTIPVFNVDKADLQRDQLELVEEKAELENRLREQRTELKILTSGFESMIDQWELINEQINFLANVESTEFPISIELITDSAEYRNDLENRRLGIYSSLLHQYIDHLHQGGKLITDPIVNHLSSTLNPLNSFDNN